MVTLLTGVMDTDKQKGNWLLPENEDSKGYVWNPESLGGCLIS